VPQVLEKVSGLQVEMALASRTSELEGANALIQLFQWSKYFTHKEIYPGSKVDHFQQ
jgi:magnesium-dependent phosphatase 1